MVGAVGYNIKNPRLTTWVCRASVHLMGGETDLAILLKSMKPQLDRRQFVFCALDRAELERLGVEALGTFHESEGITVILEKERAESANLPFTDVWAKITLTVHSGLTAVGFLAAITSKLAGAGLSVNAVSAFYHDHLFVLWEERNRALALLEELERTS